MQLTRAYEAKSEILWELPRRMRTRDGEPGKHPIAIGIALVAAGDYGIAVRPRSEDALTETVMALLETKSGGQLDIRPTGTITPSGSLLRGGDSTGHRLGCTGTLGFFARRKSDDALGFVSNNHVIAAEDQGQEGDDIIAPGQADGGAWPSDVIGHLAGNYPRLHGPKPQLVDCAFARLADGVEIARRDMATNPVPAAGKMRVFKDGRTTGHTIGVVTAFSLDDLFVEYSVGPVRFNGQIEMESLDAEPFSCLGDSGSLILTEAREPLALLFACSELGGTRNSGLTYANPLAPVLNSLGVKLVG
jgi:hypothetical protein